MPPDLTDKQNDVVFNKSGLFVVKACPGSGKTLTVAARLHRLLVDWNNPHSGIAAISFTNIAWQEIESYLKYDYHVTIPLNYPHFLGTIDSFINRFIFLPFGQRVMGCNSRPELTGLPHNHYEPIGNWLFWPSDAAECWKYCKLNSFSYDENGNITVAGPDTYRHFKQCSRNHQDCLRLKKSFNFAGYATQSDSNYFAMKLLEDIPELARTLAHRFPVMIVDEAQDSSRIQMHIIDSLIRSGLNEVMLVGDPYQAIYEWRHAEPKLFNDKFNEWKDNCVWLDENWRSTQSICDLACRLANSADPITSKNVNIVPFDHVPLLYGYENETELQELYYAFQQHCTEKGIDPELISALTRSRELVNSIIPGSIPAFRSSPWRENDDRSRQIAYAKFLFDQDAFRGAIARLETDVYRYMTGNTAHRRIDIMKHARSVGIGKWRSILFKLLCDLPESTGTISAWLPRANAILSNHTFLAGCNLAIKSDRHPNYYSSLKFEDLFSIPDIEITANTASNGTVHSVKGRSLEAVFLALKSRGATRRKYTNLLGSDLLQEEELRIVYVAITRPKKALASAVPKSDKERWQEYLFNN